MHRRGSVIRARLVASSLSPEEVSSRRSSHNVICQADDEHNDEQQGEDTLEKPTTSGRGNRLRKILLVSASGVRLGLASPAEARVKQITISSTLPAYGGATFGSVGAYEFVTGVASGEVDPNDARNRIIQDIELAPRNARGMVEYSTKFQIL